MTTPLFIHLQTNVYFQCLLIYMYFILSLWLIVFVDNKQNCILILYCTIERKTLIKPA